MIHDYIIDWSKVKTVEDLKNVMKAFGMTFDINQVPECVKPYLELRVQ